MPIKVDMSLKISAATLTYGDRLEFLYPSVDCLLTQTFDHVYIYCNGVSALVLEKIQTRYQQDSVTVLHSQTNLGSAGGYYELLRYIIKENNSDHVLLLDDDNLVPQDCFEKISMLHIEADELYYFHRPDRALPKKAKELKRPEYVLGTENSFLGRDAFIKFQKQQTEYEGDLLAAPYGGLLLSRAALDSGVMPKKEIYLYADDYEYTNRLVTEFNFKIIFSEVFLITDLEKSFHLKKGLRILTNRYSNASELQLYYSVRNSVWLGLKRSNSKFIYSLNGCIYSSIFFIQFLFSFNFKKIRVFSKAIYDGVAMYRNDSRSI
jgi:GT2 family glycosyltransferase